MRTKLVNGERVLMTPEEEAAKLAEEQDWETNIKPIEDRLRDYQRTVRQSLTFDEDEKDVLGQVYNEVKRYRIDNNSPTPLIDSMQSVFTGRTKAQIATTIEARYEAYITAAAVALANKIKP